MMASKKQSNDLGSECNDRDADFRRKARRWFLRERCLSRVARERATEKAEEASPLGRLQLRVDFYRVELKGEIEPERRAEVEARINRAIQELDGLRAEHPSDLRRLVYEAVSLFSTVEDREKGANQARDWIRASAPGLAARLDLAKLRAVIVTKSENRGGRGRRVRTSIEEAMNALVADLGLAASGRAFRRRRSRQPKP